MSKEIIQKGFYFIAEKISYHAFFVFSVVQSAEDFGMRMYCALQNDDDCLDTKKVFSFCIAQVLIKEYGSKNKS